MYRTFVTFLAGALGPAGFVFSSTFLSSSLFGLTFFAAKSELMSVGSSLMGALNYKHKRDYIFKFKNN